MHEMLSDKRNVWIVVPAFNEAGVIGDVIADLRSVFTNVVCVDDGSADDTGDVALKAGAHLVCHPVNLGQGAAIQTGVEYARRQPGAQVFATFDADGQHRVKDLVTMIDRLGAEMEALRKRVVELIDGNAPSLQHPTIHRARINVIVDRPCGRRASFVGGTKKP